MKKWITTTIIATITLAAGFLAGQVVQLDEIFLKVAPSSEEISGEAREYCIEHGMELREIVADQDACLREYWTIDRLQRSEQIEFDWGLDSGRCGLMADGTRVCDLVGDSGLPDEGDPWWEEQILRHPGRTTSPGVDVDPSNSYGGGAFPAGKD